MTESKGLRGLAPVRERSDFDTVRQARAPSELKLVRTTDKSRAEPSADFRPELWANAASVADYPIKGGINHAGKRVLDVCCAAAALIFTAPLLIAIAALVKLESPGPVIFRQVRFGYQMQKFSILKFRTMTVTEDGDNVRQATSDDERVTRFGRFLRRSSLDELPQLINVLRGEMSIVGPRPHAVVHDLEYCSAIPGYIMRFRSRPGLVGLAQLKGARGEIRAAGDIVRRTAFDLEYQRRWSLWFDLWLIGTAPVRVLAHLLRGQAY